MHTMKTKRNKPEIRELIPSDDFVNVIKRLEEVILAGAGEDAFNEIFKLIFTKLYDEKSTQKTKKKGDFYQKQNPKETSKTISKIFELAKGEWPDIFNNNEKILLSPTHLSICVGEM